jgi:para-nitrobenzyl esterase
MKKIYIVCICLITVGVYCQKTLDKGLIIKTSDGLVKGNYESDVMVFKAIPFAAPPIGQYRWRPPQAVKKWKGIYEADKFCQNCAQAGWGAAPGTLAEGSSEDCLYLNIWKPSKAKSSEKLPVMVWIHGGGFTGGSGSSPQNFGNEFSKQGVILITINYRLGRLGFFAHPALSKENKDEFKGNYGYMDQVAALKWIQKNIGQFGGDPKNVTIFGFSAGGVSVHSLVTIPSARGLFHKAIFQSSGGRDGVLTGRPINKENTDLFYKLSAESIGDNFAKKYGIKNDDQNAMEKLRALSAKDIIDGGQETNGPSGERIYSGPILDGKLVVETAESAYRLGKSPKIPILIGNCSAEIGGPFVSSSKTKEEFFASFGPHMTDVKAAYDPDGSKSFDEVITLFNTDWVWGEPGRMTAKAFISNGSKAYMYQFGYVPQAAQQRSPYGAGHGSEVSFVFNTLSARWGSTTEATDIEKELAKTMITYWSNFAKTGNPNGSGLPNWPIYDGEKQNILNVDMDGKISSKADPRRLRFDAIEKTKNIKDQIQSRGI